MGDGIFGIVPQHPRPVVWVRKLIGGRMDPAYELDIQLPRFCISRCARQVVGGVEIHGAALFDIAHIGWIDFQRELRFMLAEGAAFDSVGAEDAADDDLFFQPVGDLRQGGAAEAVVGVADPEQQGLELRQGEAELEGKRTEARGFDAPRQWILALGCRFSCPQKCPPGILKMKFYISGLLSSGRIYVGIYVRHASA